MRSFLCVPFRRDVPLLPQSKEAWRQVLYVALNTDGKMQKEYISSNHSKYLIKYHVILVCKYRRCVMLDKAMDDAVKNVLHQVTANSDFCIEVM